ncbi:MAG: DCC1-like thiol-disulfide oxidoreductase family protein [Bryobacteraceae bacterium]
MAGKVTAWWNPLRCAGTALPVPLLLMAKIIALALLVTGHVRLMPDPFLPFLPFLDSVPGDIFRMALQVLLVGSAIALLFNYHPRLRALMLGLTILLAVVSSKAYYGNNKTMCAALLLLAGLYHPRTGAWLLRAQVALAYFGAGLNKLIDADWQSGVFFHHWAGTRLGQPLYLWGASLLPPLVAAKAICWATIVTELGLAAALLLRRAWPWAIWVSLLFHAALLEFTGTTFTMFFYAMEAAMFAFVEWPREMVVIFDGECGICRRIRGWMDRVDFDGAFRWQPLQSGVGDRWALSRETLEQRLHLITDGRITSGFEACKRIPLYNPAFYLAVTLAIAAAPGGPVGVWWRRVVVAALLGFFFPLFNPVGEAVYGWVARNRRRFSNEGSCAVEPVIQRDRA